MTGPAANRPVVDEWKLIKRQDNLVKSVVLWPNHCNKRLGLISKQVLSSNRKMKVKILQECFSRIPETSVYTFKYMAKIANVHPRGVNTSGWANLTKLAKITKIANFVKFAKIVNVHPRGVNTSGWANLTKLAKDRQNCQFCQMPILSNSPKSPMFTQLLSIPMDDWTNLTKLAKHRQNR